MENNIVYKSFAFLWSPFTRILLNKVQCHKLPSEITLIVNVDHLLCGIYPQHECSWFVKVSENITEQTASWRAKELFGSLKQSIILLRLHLYALLCVGLFHKTPLKYTKVCGHNKMWKGLRGINAFARLCVLVYWLLTSLFSPPGVTR